MTMTKCLELYVAFYVPSEGNYQHWALFLDDGAKSIIWEVEGQHPNFERVERIGNPEVSPGRRFRECIYVGDLLTDDLPDIRRVIQNVLVDNETFEWDCQEYVLDILEALVDEFILEDTATYAEVHDILITRRGPMI